MECDVETKIHAWHHYYPLVHGSSGDKDISHINVSPADPFHSSFQLLYSLLSVLIVDCFHKKNIISIISDGIIDELCEYFWK